MTPACSESSCLVLVRAGASSLHGSYSTSGRRFDFALSSFVECPPDADGAVFVDHVAGPKWTGLLATIRARWDIVSRYRYVWLPDDDLRATADAVNRLFDRCEEFDLDLAQPALTRDSYFSHVITLEHLSFQLRFTNFVELMAPLCSRAQLERMLPTLGAAVSGWGLDFVWPRLSSVGRVAILDDSLVTHTRPVGGPSYAHNRSAGLAPSDEMHLTAARYGVDHFVHLNLGGIARDGTRLELAGGGAETEAMIAALIHSTAGCRVLPTELIRYLGRHVAYARNEPLGEEPNRAFLKAALEMEFSKRPAAPQIDAAISGSRTAPSEPAGRLES